MKHDQHIALLLALIVGLNIILISWFYPQLLQYQSGSVVGRYIVEQKIPADKFFFYKFTGSGKSIHFYAKHIIGSIDSLDAATTGTYLYTSDEGLKEIQQSGKLHVIEKEGPDYHVTALTGKFLNKNTREEQCGNYYVVKML